LLTWGGKTVPITPTQRKAGDVGARLYCCSWTDLTVLGFADGLLGHVQRVLVVLETRRRAALRQMMMMMTSGDMQKKELMPTCRVNGPYGGALVTFLEVQV
jgi:hypothetical protein